MGKQEFKSIIADGIGRNKRFLAVKIKNDNEFHPRVIVIQSEDITLAVNRYLIATDNEMIFKDTGDQIIDALMTSNINDMSWFVY